MTIGLRIRLSAMMFLELFIWGAWAPVLMNYLTEMKWSAYTETIYGLMGLASIFMPIIAGQITDRWMANQKFLGLAQLAGGAGLILAAAAKSYDLLFWGMLLWALAYAPTISLTNSLAFTHMKDPEKDFGPIRLFGTFGWIAAGLALSGLWNTKILEEGGSDCLFLAGGASILMGLFAFALPDTPPARTGVSPFAFLKAFALLKNPRIAAFLLVSFVGGMTLQFYFTVSGDFLRDLGTQQKNIPLITGIGQFFEIAAMLSLPWFLKTYGPRLVLFFGMLAFALRNLIFAIGMPYGFVVGSIALHGVSFVFFFVVSFIYFDMVAPKDIKASAQGLLTLIVFGFGNWIGNMFVKEVKDWFPALPESLAEGAPPAIQWMKFFLVPTAMAALCAVVFLLTFPKGSMKEASAAPEAAPVEPRSS